MPAQAPGYNWDATEAQLMLGDFNGDSLADLLLVLPQLQLALSFIATDQVPQKSHSLSKSEFLRQQSNGTISF